MAKIPLVGRVMSFVRKPAESGRKQPKSVDRGERLRLGFEHAPVGIAVASPDGHWLQVNERFRALVGYTREELARISFHSITHPDDAKREAAFVRKLMSGDLDSYRITKRVMERKGRYRAVDIVVSAVRSGSGEPELIVYAVDEPQGAEQAPRDQERFLGALIDQLGDVAIIRSDTRGSITAWNAGAERILGYSRDEVIGRSRRLLFRDPDTWEGKPTRQFSAADSGRLELDDWRVAKNGAHVWVHVTILPFRQDGEVKGYVELITPPPPAPPTIDTKHARQAIDDLRAQVEKGKRVEESLREALEGVRVMAEETMNELRIMTVALRNEMDRRKQLEEDLRLANEKLAAPPPPPVEIEEEVIEIPTRVLQPLAGRAADLLADLGAAQRTGTFVIRGEAGEKEFFFDRGRVFSCASTNPDGHLTQRLIARGWLTDDQRRRAMEIRAETHLALGRILLILGAIDEEQLLEAMREKMIDEVAELASWTDARWAFVDGEVPSLQLVPLRVDPAELVASADARVREAVVVASTKTKKYHRPNCIGVRRLSGKARLELPSAAEAVRRGLHPCGTCAP